MIAGGAAGPDGNGALAPVTLAAPAALASSSRAAALPTPARSPPAPAERWFDLSGGGAGGVGVDLTSGSLTNNLMIAGGAGGSGGVASSAGAGGTTNWLHRSGNRALQSDACGRRRAGSPGYPRPRESGFVPGSRPS